MRHEYQTGIDAIHEALREEFEAPVIRSVIDVYTYTRGQRDVSDIREDALWHGLETLNTDIVRMMCLAFLAGRNRNDAA
jgi:hypothetical protein